MGAAAAAVAAAEKDGPDGLVLLAPFAGGIGFLGALFPLMRRTVPVIKPFRLFRLDFSNPDVRQGLANFIPDLDLDDPNVQQAIREVTLPTASLDELRLLGQAARRAAPAIRVPTFVIQGTQDRVVWPQKTRQFLDQFTSPVRYREVIGAHDLLDATRPAWPAITRAVVEFAQGLARSSTAKHNSASCHAERPPKHTCAARTCRCPPITSKPRCFGGPHGAAHDTQLT